MLLRKTKCRIELVCVCITLNILFKIFELFLLFRNILWPDFVHSLNVYVCDVLTNKQTKTHTYKIKESVIRKHMRPSAQWLKPMMIKKYNIKFIIIFVIRSEQEANRKDAGGINWNRDTWRWNMLEFRRLFPLIWKANPNESHSVFVCLYISYGYERQSSGKKPAHNDNC